MQAEFFHLAGQTSTSIQHLCIQAIAQQPYAQKYQVSDPKRPLCPLHDQNTLNTQTGEIHISLSSICAHSSQSPSSHGVPTQKQFQFIGIILFLLPKNISIEPQMIPASGCHAINQDRIWGVKENEA